MTSTTTDAALTVVYDGECPFCSNYVRLMALRRSVGTVALVDARSGGPLVDEIARRGYDLNEGMVVRHGRDLYYGSDALVLLSRLSDDQGVTSRVVSRVLSSPGRARLLYPVMKLGRRVTLLLLGRTLIARPDGASAR